MIDTIILALPSDKARIRGSQGGGFESWDLQKRTQAYHKFVKNPSAKDEESGLYFPRLTGFRRAEGKLEWQSTIYIEFSAPKLLYGNNLDELEETDFERVLAALEERLNMMGVVVSRKTLAETAVRVAHYSKNLRLTDGYTASFVIRELGKISANKRFDLSRATFTNDGQSLQIYTVAHSFVIYDKIADLAKGKRRAIDKDQPPEQKLLFPQYKRQDDILRLEVRLSQKRKLTALFKQFDYEPNPTFREVFSLAKSQRVVRHYWDTFIAGHGVSLFSHSSTPKDLLSQVLLARPAVKGKTAIYLTALLLLSRDENGLRELRSMLTRHMDDRSWHRMAADLRGIAADLSKLRPREWYGQVAQALTNYQPTRLASK